jgi:hypothetical protein
MFVPYWLFIVLSAFGIYGALVFIDAIRNRKSKVVSPSASRNKQSTPCPHLSCRYFDHNRSDCSKVNRPCK